MSQSVRKLGEPSSYHAAITEWPERERPREKLLAGGPAALSDAELLAILIRTGTGTGETRITAVDIAKTLLKSFSSLRNLSSKTVNEFTTLHGMGKTKAITLIAAFELGRRIAASEPDVKLQIRSPEDVVKRFQPHLRDLKYEVFKVILLDSANHLVKEVEVSRGILNSSLAHPREVFCEAILGNAASVILLHNHPSGNPEPSSEDLIITRQMSDAGKIIGIPVHDHIIIAANSYTSFAERGFL